MFCERTMKIISARDFSVRRFIQCLLILVIFPSLVSFSAPSPLFQDDNQGYWDLFDTSTDSSWVGDNYRGLKARYSPFFASEYSIGSTYEERNIQFKKDVEPGIFITEKATCSLSGYDQDKHRLLNPGDSIPLTLGVQGSLIGSGTVKEVHKAQLRFRNLEDDSTNQNILYVESFQDKTTTNDMVDEAPITKSGKWLVPVGKKAGEVRALEISCFVAGGIVKVHKYFKYRWTVQETSSDVDENAPVVPKQPGKPTVETKCPPPYDGTPQQKLQEILSQYYKKIKPGVYSSGAKNNAMSVLPGYGHLEVFRCGGYQGEIIKFLEEIKFNSDPCVASLLDDWDYGPIQAWFGGHQAVVLYPTGGDWLSQGLVLDPWMNQKPEVYTIKKWAQMWSQFKSYGGIGPSTVYEPNFPTHGGIYANPKNTKLTQEQRDYISSLPKAQRDKYDKMGSTGQLAFLRRHRENIQKGNKFVTHSPLTAYVTDADGRKTGLVNGDLVREIKEVYFSAFPLADGTIVTQLEYPPDLGFSLVTEGTGEGTAHVFSSFMSADDEFADPQSFVYTFKAENGGQYRLGPDPGSDLTANNGALKAKPLDAAAEGMIKSLPDIPIPPVYMNAPSVENTPQTISEVEEDDSLFLGMGAGLVCLCAGVIGIAGVVVLVLILRKKRRQTT